MSLSAANTQCRYSLGEMIGPFTAGGAIWEGGLVCIKRSDGKAYAGADTSGYSFLGVACDNYSTGDTDVAVWVEGEISVVCTGVAITDNNKVGYISDDNTILLVGAANDIKCGIIHYEKSGYARLKFSPLFGKEQIVAESFPDYPVDADKTITAGNLVMMDEAVGDVMEAADTTGMRFVGVAREAAVNTGGGTGDVEVEVQTVGRVTVTVAAADDTWVGKTAYATAALTCALTSTHEVAVGTFEEITSATVAVVKYDLNRIDEKDLLHATGDGTDVTAYTDVDGNLIHATGDAALVDTYLKVSVVNNGGCYNQKGAFGDIGSTNPILVKADAHSKLKLIAGWVVLVDIPDASGDTLEVQIFDTQGTPADMTDKLTFTEGVETAGATKFFTVEGTDHTIVSTLAAELVITGNTSSAGVLVVYTLWEPQT